MRFVLSFFSLLLLTSFSVLAQHTRVPDPQFLNYTPDGKVRCASVEMENWRRAQNPELETPEAFENWLAREIENRLHSNQGSRVVFTIPVIVHVIHEPSESPGSGRNISQAQILSQIDVLNEDFRKMFGTPGYNTHPDGADVEIEFCAALVDPAGNVLPEPGIDRINRSTAGFTSSPYSTTYINNTIKPNTYWDPNSYLNMWTVSITGGILGYAQFPNSSGLPGLSSNGGAASTDGVVILYNAFGRIGNVSYPYNGGRTATHEVGHWLGLRHIWGDGGCTVDDYCADTPNCSGDYYANPPSCSAPVQCSVTRMIENYMDYSGDGCMNIFTEDQKTRMQTVMMVSPRRASLASSLACSLPNAVPVANFTSDITSGCPGLMVSFTDLSTNNPNAYSWSFPGGNPSSSTLPNPTVTYPTAGTFNVSLTVTNPFGTDAITQTGYISVSTSGIEVFFMEDFESGSITSNGWSLVNPDNADTWEVTTIAGTPTGTNAAYVNLYYYNAAGQRDGLVSPVLDFSSHTSTLLEFDHAHRRYSTNEHDSLLVYVSTNGGASYPFRVFAQAESGAGNFATNTATTSNFVPATSDDWCFAGSVGASCFDVDLSAFDGMSNIRLMFEIYNDYGNNIFIDNVMVSGVCNTGSGGLAPVAAFSAPTTSACGSLNVNFQDNSSNTPTSWSWSFPGGTPASSNLPNPAVSYSSPGSYNVTLSVSNSIGSDILTLPGYIKVNDYPSVSLSSTDTDCGVSTGSATANVTGGATPYSYQWSNGQAGSSVMNLAAGTYTVTVTDANGCPASANVTVGTNTILPVANFTYMINAGTAAFTNGSSNGISYLWDFGDGGASTLPNPNHTYLSSGSYTVVLTVTNACGTDTITQNVSIELTGLEEDLFPGGLNIYPNPNDGNFVLDVSGSKVSHMRVSVINTIGQSVFSRDFSLSNGSLRQQLSISELAPGAYFLKVEVDGKALYRKMLVQ